MRRISLVLVLTVFALCIGQATVHAQATLPPSSSSPGLLKAGLDTGLAMVSALAQGAPPPILLNPEGVISFDSIDHDKAVSYRVGWFRTEDQAEPDVSESILVPSVTTNATGLKYTMQARTRPPFRKYILKIKLIALTASCDADLGPCESAWSLTAAWTKDGNSGTWLGYTPRNASGVVLH
jgi:hypothetical protein